jgi:hypothetical protein
VTKGDRDEEVNDYLKQQFITGTPDMTPSAFWSPGLRVSGNERMNEQLTEGPRPPASVPSPPEHRVNGLIPFVHVEDVEREPRSGRRCVAMVPS